MSAVYLLLGLAALGSVMGLFDSGDDGSGDDADDDLVIDERPDETETGQETGATVDTEADGSVTVTVGADEPGSLVAVTFVDTQDSQNDFYQTYQLRLYLVPQGIDLPDNTSEEASNVPGASAFFADQPNGNYNLANMESELGLELLHVIDLKPDLQGSSVSFQDLIDGGVDALDRIDANRPIASYYAEAQTDGDSVELFLPSDYTETFNGVENVTVTTSQSAGAEANWLTVRPGSDGISVVGGGGDDRLETYSDLVRLSGQAGNDVLFSGGDNTLMDGGIGNDSFESGGDNATILGGDGDDQVTSSGINGTVSGGTGSDSITLFAGTASGGAGVDYITGYGTSEDVQVFGDGGDDFVSAIGARATGHGGAGNDFIGVRDGATGYGDLGNDQLQVDAGARGFGGDGNDLIQVWEQHASDETAVVTGGAGADTYDLSVWNPFGTDAVPYTRITDFDPNEDILQVGVFQTTGASVSGISLTEAPDGSYTDVIVNFANDSFREPGVATIRLDGVTGMTASQVVIMA